MPLRLSNKIKYEMSKKATRAIANWRSITYVTAEKSKFTHMKSPLTTCLRKQTPINKRR